MSLRHSFATAAIRAGLEVSSVSRWFGYAAISTTYNKYVRPTLKNLQEDSAAIDTAFETA